MIVAPFTPEELKERAIRTRKLVTWLIILAIVMFFAGLTSAYVVSMSGGYWVDIKIPPAFLISTGAIVVSSVFAQLALMAAQKGRTRKRSPHAGDHFGARPGLHVEPIPRLEGTHRKG
jgi:heme/copper-type cytochrome/quinol oxidase subunit 3